MTANKEQLYEFRWGNTEKRAKLKGRICRVLIWGKKGSCYVEFLDTGEKHNIRLRALRKVKP